MAAGEGTCKDPKKLRKEQLDVLEHAEKIRRIGNFAALSSLNYDDAYAVFRAKSEPIPGPVGPQRAEIRDGHAVAKDGGELLIDDKNDDLERLVLDVDSVLTSAIDGEEDSAIGDYKFEGEQQQFKFEVERDVLTCVRYFCSADVLGRILCDQNTIL